MTLSKNIAIIGAGMAGVVCARTLQQAGHRVELFEKSHRAGGRMATRQTEFGSFDHGAQYFTVRDKRFALGLTTATGLYKPWSANTVRVLDELGRMAAAGLPARESHWVPVPGMNALLAYWSQPLAQSKTLHTETRVTRLEADALQPKRWQLRTDGTEGSYRVFSNFDHVLLAIPSVQAHELLLNSKQTEIAKKLEKVQVAPCWTLMLAFPQAMQPGLMALGPQWNAARSTHHRIAWLARESSKPGREPIERWTIQASAAWSQEHLEDDAPRVLGKLQKAFSEVTGIRAQPTYAAVHRWRYAQTQQALGTSHLWDRTQGLGICGDWCIGHRVEDAFLSGLALALAVA